METKEIIEQVNATILKHDMIKTGDHVLMGVSGGADSIGMVHILLMLCSAELNIQLGIAHFDHGLRGTQSQRDAGFVDGVARKFNLPFYLEKEDISKFSIDHKLSVEEAGRTLRYQFLFKTAADHGFDKIALGHNRNDMAETVLMNIFRGSGPQGIAGIPPKRGMIIRPLIDILKSDIETFVDRENIAFVTDSSNNDLCFLRNQIRLELIPLLASSYNSDIVETLSRTAEIFREEQSWIDTIINPLFESVRLDEDEPNIALSIPDLKKTPLAASRRIIRKAIFQVKGNLQGVGFKHMDAIFELMLSPHGKNKILDLPGPIKIKREHARLIIVRRKNSGRTHSNSHDNMRNFPGFSYQINEPGSVYIKEIDYWIELEPISADQVHRLKQLNVITETGQEAYMDMSRAGFPITIRSWSPEDRFSPLGLRGTQKVKKFLSNNKVPLSKRKTIAILEHAGCIIWVAGFRIDNCVRIKTDSEKVLKARLFKRSV